MMIICSPLSGYSGTVELTPPSQKPAETRPIPPIPCQNLLFSVARGTGERARLDALSDHAVLSRGGGRLVRVRVRVRVYVVDVTCRQAQQTLCSASGAPGGHEARFPSGFGPGVELPPR